ncbi:MAG: glucosamine-6-phosphate deaminase [Opitutales bacterium]
MSSPLFLTPSRFEHIPLSVYASSADASRAVAQEVAALIRAGSAAGRRTVLGLATGSTPLRFYAELVRLHREEGLSFAGVVTFNLDEYCGLPPEHAQSYHHFMRVNLFDHLDIPAESIHIPDGMLSGEARDAAARDYEELIRSSGGIDLQILGIGRTGHIGFNEPGSARRSRTRQVTLDPLTRRDAAGDFGGEEQTPNYAVTMGVRNIMEARRIVLMAWGQHKAAIVRQAVEGPVTPQLTASFLQEHDNAQFVLDTAAASALTRYRTPWLIGPLEDQGLAWDERMTRRAIVWLSREKAKPILKLTDEDYNVSGLQDLLQVHGSAYEANLTGFYQLQHTITGWPGGRDPQRTKPGDAPVRPLRAATAGVFPKRILVLSPHPDDDVISMGGTLCRLVEHGHAVHIAYQTSGSNSVSDESLWRALRFAQVSGIAATALAPELAELDRAFVQHGALPAKPELVRWKALLRRNESVAAARVCGVPGENLHFLDLPFYYHDAGRREIGAADVDRMAGLLNEVEPHLIFAAGDLDNPHGTHRLCLRALREALARCAGSGWFRGAELWLYRGAWGEWETDEIDLAVPLSPQELLRRRRAIFRHEIQREQTLFPGGGRAEYWQMIEERGRRLADTYNALGLAEYEAIESFKRYAPDDFIQHVPA